MEGDFLGVLAEETEPLPDDDKAAAEVEPDTWATAEVVFQKRHLELFIEAYQHVSDHDCEPASITLGQMVQVVLMKMIAEAERLGWDVKGMR